MKISKTVSKMLASFAVLGSLSGIVLITNNQAYAAQNFKGEKLKIGTWNGADTEQAGLKKLIKGFEKKTGAKITQKVYTNYRTQISADFAARKAPDAFYMDSSDYPWFISQGVLSKLSKKQMQVPKFYSTLIKAFETKGNLYGVPKDDSTLGLLVNKKIFSKVGVDPKTIPTSYETLIKWLPGFQAKLDKAYGKGKVTAMTYNQDMARNYQIMTVNGGKPIKANGTPNLASKKVVVNLNLYKKLVATGAVATAKDLGSGDNGTAFGTGKVAMTEEGNWTYQVQKKQYKTDFEVLPMLSYQGKRRGMIFTVGWGENAESKNKKLASSWIQYVTSKKSMATWAKTVGVMPSRPDVAKAIHLSDDSSLKTWFAATKYSTVWQAGTSLVTLNTSYQNFINDAVTGKTTIQKAMKQADRQAQAAINKSK
ncbi:sugar ABC transporter substrate-binding protein [Oenococcus sicerae]|uniref:Extracellular solute-binding protein n=1 Tax=Oenococcus sicerae TaxID=2203724 RepID=A0AAJ1RDD8_9LACO|nr:extracellular solute-binding protein [Oenococcus sicerae]MDN6900945.1 extracellular solute-binding protein [Oenococcus sicerae]